MPTPEKVKTVLDTVLVPGVMRSLVKMNLVKDVSVTDGKIDITLATAVLMKGAQDWLKDKVKDAAAAKLDGVKEVNVSYTEIKPKELNSINSVIAIMSGKGGVGKSLVASLAAIA